MSDYHKKVKEYFGYESQWHNYAPVVFTDLKHLHLHISELKRNPNIQEKQLIRIHEHIQELIDEIEFVVIPHGRHNRGD